MSAAYLLQHRTRITGMYSWQWKELVAWVAER